MRMNRESIGRLILRAAGLFVLGLFLQLMGMPKVATQPGTIYSQVASAIGTGPPQESLAKLPPQ